MAPFAANDNLPFVADMLAWHTVRLTLTNPKPNPSPTPNPKPNQLTLTT